MTVLTLDLLPLDQTARVTGLTCQGLIRRRLLDLGFVPGAEVRPVRRSPFGDPTAYQIKGTQIALRRTEAGTVLVQTP